MEYEEEQNNVAGSVPECGAIFMANVATKRECFKRKVFVLPSSMENFVKQVKAGMILFLFEFEKRQLFGVYEATSNGTMNILTKAISSCGRQFPAQVCFATIWNCSPLSENEFRSAIKQNYYSAKKFNFGLSEDQVRHLLQLFSVRRLKDQLPSRQHTTAFDSSVSQGRRWFNQGGFAARDRLVMDHNDEDFTAPIMHEYLENSEDRGIEVDDDRIFIDDRVEDEEKVNSIGQEFLTEHAGRFPCKKRRVYHDKSKTGLYRTRALQPPFGTNNLEIPSDKELISAASGRILRGDILMDNQHFNSSVPVHTPKYRGDPSDLPKRADCERLFFNGTNRLPADDDKFLMNNIMETKLNLHSSLRPVIANEHEAGFLERARKFTDNHEFLMSSRLGHKNHLDYGSTPEVPTESFENSRHRMRGTTENGKLLMSERIASEHDLDNGLSLSHSSDKFGNSFDTKQIRADERIFSSRENLVKANYMDGLPCSTNLNMSTRYELGMEGQAVDKCGFGKSSSVDHAPDAETLKRPLISTKRNSFIQTQQSSLESLSRPLPDNQFCDFTDLQNIRTSNSTFHDAIVTETAPWVSELPRFHNGHPLSGQDDQSSSLARGTTPYPFGGDFLALSKIKSFEAECSNRFHASDFGKTAHFPSYQDHCNYHTAEFSDGLDLKSIGSANFRNFKLSPSTSDSVPLTESHDFHPSTSSLAFEAYCPGELQGMWKHIPHRTNGETYAGNEPLSSNIDFIDWDKLESNKGYKTDIADNHSQYPIIRDWAHSDLENHRKSVFTRLTSTQRSHAREEGIAGFDADTSVDEITEIMHRSKNFRMKSLKKFMPVVRQHDEGEMARNVKKMSHVEHGHLKFMSVKINENAKQTIGENIDEKPDETRVIEFKRRREIIKTMDHNGVESNILRKEDGMSGQNAEPDGPFDKQPKRRKLVRPVFSSKEC